MSNSAHPVVSWVFRAVRAVRAESLGGLDDDRVPQPRDPPAAARHLGWTVRIRFECVFSVARRNSADILNPIENGTPEPLKKNYVFDFDFCQIKICIRLIYVE